MSTDVRPIHKAKLDKVRPVLVLTRDAVRPHLTNVTIAPITSIVRGLSTELEVGSRNGLDRRCVVSCDNVTTIPASELGDLIGFLFDSQEAGLSAAIHAAFDLE